MLYLKELLIWTLCFSFTPSRRHRKPLHAGGFNKQFNNVKYREATNKTKTGLH